MQFTIEILVRVHGTVAPVQSNAPIFELPTQKTNDGWSIIFKFMEAIMDKMGGEVF